MSELKAEEKDQGAEVEAEAVEALPVEIPDQTPDPHSLGLELPDDPDEAIALLLREVAAAREEASSYLDDLKRVAADFDNYRKRSMRESATMVDRAAERVIRNLMPVLDTFDAGLNIDAKTDSERQLYSGLINTRQQLLKSLEAEGLEVIPTIGERFNPEIHEPAGAPGGEGELIVSDELRRGYTLKGKVLRAALVSLEAEE